MIRVTGRVGAALALAWRARPALLAGYVAARLLAGALPAVAGGVAGPIIASLEDIVSLFRIPQAPARGTGR